MILELKAIYGKDKPTDIYKMMVDDFKDKDIDEVKVYNKYIPFIWSTDSIFTIKNRYTDIRKRISNQRILKSRKEKLIELFTLDSSFFAATMKKSNENIIENINEKKEFSIDDYMNELKVFKKIVESKDISNIKTNGNQKDDYLLALASAFYLALNSGRRMFEIFVTLNLHKKGKNVFYSGLAKKDEEKESAQYEAYLLDGDIQTSKNALRYIRKYYNFDEDMTNSKFNNTYQKSINTAVKRYFDDSLTFSSFRDMYSDIAIEKFKPKKEDTEIFRAKVLAHEIKLTAKDSYRKTQGV